MSDWVGSDFEHGELGEMLTLLLMSLHRNARRSVE